MHSKRKKKRRVLIVDDHPVVREGLTMAINEESDLEVCGEAEDADKALETIPRLGPDIVLVDLSLPSLSGEELIVRLRKLVVNLPLLVVSMHDDPAYALRCLRLGAEGYVVKSERVCKVIDAIRTVLQGDMYISKSLHREVMKRLLTDETEDEGDDSVEGLLTKRELEIFQLIGAGITLRQIAKNLYVSIRTVQTHRDRIRKKLGLASAVELQYKAIRWAHRESATAK